MQIRESAIQNEINKDYQRLGSKIITVAIKDYDLLLRNYLLTGNTAKRVTSVNDYSVYLVDVISFILSLDFEFYSASNIKGDTILLEITKRVGREVIRQNEHKKDEIISRYNFIRTKLDKAITYRTLVREVKIDH